MPASSSGRTLDLRRQNSVNALDFGRRQVASSSQRLQHLRYLKKKHKQPLTSNTTNNSQQTTANSQQQPKTNNQQRTTVTNNNNEQQAKSNRKLTTNNEQQTTNNKQQTANSKQQAPSCGGPPICKLADPEGFILDADCQRFARESPTPSPWWDIEGLAISHSLVFCLGYRLQWLTAGHLIAREKGAAILEGSTHICFTLAQLRCYYAVFVAPE